MESKNKELSSVIISLVQLNQQRRDGYEKAIVACDGHFPELKMLFRELSDESRGFINELETKLQHLDADTDSNASEGKISRMWNHVKWAYTGVNKDGILQSANEAEEMMQEAYQDALKDDAEMSAETRQLIIDQKMSLQADGARIKSIMHGNEVPVK